MINEQRTLELFGYTSDELSPKSHKYIIKVCDDCGTYSITSKNKYCNLCQSCACKQRDKLPKPKLVEEKNRYLNNTGIDRIETIKQFGYDPVDLSNQSNRKIIAICQDCGKSREVVFQKYSNLCQSCSNKQKENRIIISCTLQGINRNDFTGFLTDQRYCKLFNNKFKEKIRKRFHYKCFLCGKTTKHKLSVHHVNYNKNCLCGSNCEFVPLCGSCHAKTNYNRQYWENLIMGYLYPNRYFMSDI